MVYCRSRGSCDTSIGWTSSTRSPCAHCQKGYNPSNGGLSCWASGAVPFAGAPDANHVTRTFLGCKVRQGHGKSGANRDYVLATVKELAHHGYRDENLRRLAEKLKGTHQTAL